MKSARLNLKVSPKASENSIRGWMGETLKISVTAAPDKGKANQAVLKLLARTIDHPVSQIQIVSGQHQPNKIVRIDNLDDREIRDRIAKVLK